MINEVAIDPEVLLEWSKDRGKSKEFLNNYGLGTRRIVSSFPKNKPSKLISFLMRKVDSLDDENHKHRYGIMIESLRECLYLRESKVNSNKDWYELIQNEVIPFDTVIARKNFDCENILTLEDLSESDFLYLDHQISFNRTQKDFIKSIRGLVNLTTSKIVVVDAYAWKPNSIKVIKSIIDEVNNRRFKSQQVEFTVIYKEINYVSPAPNASFFKSEIEKEFDSFPTDIDLKVIQLKESDESDTFHNRYIMNNFGGVSLGHGLDIADKEHTTDEITMLSKNTYTKRWNQFVKNLDFQIVDLA